MPTKFITIIAITLAFITSARAQDHFTLSGTLSGPPEAKIYLLYPDAANKQVLDSSVLTADQTFAFKGKILYPTRAFIWAKVSGKEKRAMVYLTPSSQMELTGNITDLSTVTLTGSKTQDEYVYLKSLTDAVDAEFSAIAKRIDALDVAYQNATKEKRSDKVIDSIAAIKDSLKDLRGPFALKQANIIRKFINDNPASFISLNNFRVFINTSSWTLDELKTTYNNFSADVKNSPEGVAAKDAITKREETLLVKPAFNFSRTDIKGKKISLADFKGKYILLDFWGSWCIPCRKGTPFLKEIFGKYHSSGLEVIGIACADKPEDWARAIQKDGTDMWHHIRQDEKANPRELDDEYEVHVFPTKILIDKNGNMIARFVGEGDDAALGKKLAEVLGK